MAYDPEKHHRRSLNSIRQYIVENPLAWPDDAENPSGSGKNRLDDFLEHLEGVYAALKKGDTSVAPTRGADAPA